MPSLNITSSTAVSVAIGLALAGGAIYFKIKAKQEEERENQARMEEQGRFVDEYVRKQNTVPNGIKQSERDLMGALGVALPFVEKLRKDDLAAAYKMTSPAYQQRVGEAAFELFVHKHPDVKDADACQLIVNFAYTDGGVSSKQVGDVKEAATTVINVTVAKGDKWAVSDLKIEPRKK